MPTIPCPACGLPRAEDLFETTPCPLCGHAARRAGPPPEDGEPESDLPWIIPEDPPHHAATDPGPIAEEIPAESGRPSRKGLLAGVLVGVLAGVGGTVAWPLVRDVIPSLDFAQVTAPDPAPAGPTGEPDSSAAATPADPPPASPATSPPPSSSVATPVRVPPGPNQPVVIGRPPEQGPLNPFHPNLGPAKRLDDSVVTYAPSIPPGGSLVVRGKVRRFIVPGLEGGAVLDASDLETKEVVVVGAITGGSRLSARAPNGRVRFLSRVDGRSVVEVKAPGGEVLFENPTVVGQDGSKIDDGSRVEVAAKDVRFAGKITGAGTQVSVTLTPGGGMSFAEIDGPARLEYRRSAPSDPEPVVARGKVRAPAVVARAE